MKSPVFNDAEPGRLARLDSARLLEGSSDEHLAPITRMACEIFAVPAAFVLFAFDDKTSLRGVQGIVDGESLAALDDGLRTYCWDRERIVADAREDQELANHPMVTGRAAVTFLACEPIRFEGRTVGAMCLVDRQPRQLSASQSEILRNLARWVQNELRIAALSEAQANLLLELEEARRDSYVDALTRVWNRRGADRLLHEEIERARRRDEMVALMMIDIDHFKSINDGHGHAAGDLALKTTAATIQATVRPYDIIARLGGDELLVFAGNCSPELAKSLAGRISRRVSGKDIVDGSSSFRVTLSIGVFAGPAGELPEMLAQADAALYAAKAAGRNCVRLAATSTVS